MKLKDLTNYLDSAVPLSFQESYDNSGLQVGSPDAELTSALVCLDVTEEIVSEAISKNCNVIVSHHPLIFNGIRKLSGRSSTERIIATAIKKDISVYSLHTNLDILNAGVSRIIAQKLQLENITVLSPSEKKLIKLVTFIPESYAEKVRNAIFEAGAGVIGNYDNCGFSVAGTGSFRANENASPFTGEKNKLHFEKEIRFETILFSHMQERVIRALLESHPYEEVAYDLYPLENTNIESGLGCIGVLNEPVTEDDFLKSVKDILQAKGLRYSRLTGKLVKSVAVCGGSGASLINAAIKNGAQVFLTADLKYHDFFRAEDKILLVDAGHFETEKFSRELIKELIIKKFPKFAVLFSETNTNPINYF